MAANIFGRYVWLIEQFRRYGRLTYEEVNDLWHRSGLSYGDDDDLALRIGAVNFRVQRLQSRQHVRAGVTVVVVRSDADHRHRGLHSRQERLG